MVKVHLFGHCNVSIDDVFDHIEPLNGTIIVNNNDDNISINLVSSAYLGHCPFFNQYINNILLYLYIYWIWMLISLFIRRWNILLCFYAVVYFSFFLSRFISLFILQYTHSPSHLQLHTFTHRPMAVSWVNEVMLMCKSHIKPEGLTGHPRSF